MMGKGDGRQTLQTEHVLSEYLSSILLPVSYSPKATQWNYRMKFNKFLDEYSEHSNNILIVMK